MSTARGGGGAATGQVRRPPGARRGRRATLPFPPAPRPLLGPGTRSRLFTSSHTRASTPDPNRGAQMRWGPGGKPPWPRGVEEGPPHTHWGGSAWTGMPSAPSLPPSLLLEGRRAWGWGSQVLSGGAMRPKGCQGALRCPPETPSSLDRGVANRAASCKEASPHPGQVPRVSARPREAVGPGDGRRKRPLPVLAQVTIWPLGLLGEPQRPEAWTVTQHAF